MTDHSDRAEERRKQNRPWLPEEMDKSAFQRYVAEQCNKPCIYRGQFDALCACRLRRYGHWREQ